jgi:hypothetical protein
MPLRSRGTSNSIVPTRAVSFRLIPDENSPDRKTGKTEDEGPPSRGRGSLSGHLSDGHTADSRRRSDVRSGALPARRRERPLRRLSAVQRSPGLKRPSRSPGRLGLRNLGPRVGVGQITCASGHHFSVSAISVSMRGQHFGMGRLTSAAD